MSEVGLKRYQDFKNILSAYKMSDRAKDALQQVDLVLIVAPTSTGKNTLIRHLLETGKYYFIVSDTTRAPQFRDGKMETNGVEYFFRNEDEILADLERGEFLEAAIIHEQQVSGISIRELEKAKQINKVALADVDIVGADNIKHANPSVKAIFLVPPSFEEWQKRISGKAVMSKQEIDNRMRGALKEIKFALSADFFDFIVAEDIDTSVKIIDDLVHGKADPHQERAKIILKAIQAKLEEM